MKKADFLFALICFILPKPPMAEKPTAETAKKPAAFVVEAGRYAWAWADAQYYSCFALPEKEAI
ncbi:hypothetical protein SDC9_212722 [bioreactor metagenome]|uniref:Uncharacterized protein n=1 Tax=bioreactor metagenome TaxID=1076179 RepID=A0A645K1G0_9ZZZZ